MSQHRQNGTEWTFMSLTYRLATSPILSREMANGVGSINATSLVDQSLVHTSILRPKAS